jgi:hypothetical protein
LTEFNESQATAAYGDNSAEVFTDVVIATDAVDFAVWSTKNCLAIRAVAM